MNSRQLFRNGWLLLFCLLSAVVATAQWPKVIPIQDGGKITIYQPQPESLNGDKITGRAAVSVKRTSQEDLIFGAIFFVASIATDKDSRTALLESVNITNAKFPGVADSNQVGKLENIIQTEVPKWNMEISLDKLVTSINVENAGKGNEQFENNPPKILYSNKPSTLVMLDGAPKIQKDKNLDANRVINTPSLILEDGGHWNLYSGGIWYKSSSITEGWQPNSNLSAKLRSVNDQIKKQEKENNDGKAVTAKPEVTAIIVSTVPAELLQTKGEPEFKTIQGTSLLYVSNTGNDIFKDINSQRLYVLLAGRWYYANNIRGQWTYIAADQLPADFAKIPEGTEKDNVLANVAGTPAAEEAKIDAQIPQTAKVDRKTASITVEYDGAPQFKSIDGTSLELAENSNHTVLKDATGKYFAIDNGVWFVSNSVNGPWAVAEERPKDIEKIPPGSAAYNTKYVYVYDSTPEYVYVGYTPGYMGSYVYGPTVVYGTGFYYNSWYGAMFYPRPVTWGFGFSYNPWYGWSMGIGFNVGFMHIGFSFGGGYGWGGGWFGPAMYRPPYRPYYGGGGYYGHHTTIINTGNINIGNNINRNNIYNNHKGITTRNPSRDVNRGTGGIRNNNRPNARPVANGNNNVFADHNGNTFQRNNKGDWSQRNNQSKQWTKPQNTNFNRDLNRDYQNRYRGATREHNFQQHNRSYGGGYRGGGMRGGGGRRR